MYSRYEARRELPIRLPEHYGGTAFSERASSEMPDTHRVEIAKPSPPSFPPPSPPTNAPLERPIFSSFPVCSQAEEPTTTPPLPSAPLHIGFPFLHGIGFDELLILGLILLVSHTDEQSDMVLWLALLLFCG